MDDVKLITKLFNASIEIVSLVDQLAIDNGMVDFTSYLEWKDKLNELSMDPDRD